MAALTPASYPNRTANIFHQSCHCTHDVLYRTGEVIDRLKQNEKSDEIGNEKVEELWYLRKQGRVGSRKTG